MKIKLACLLLVGLGSMAAHGQTVSDALRECGKVQNSLKRLVCYDGIVKQLDRYGNVDALLSVPAPLPADGRAQSPSPAANPRPAAPPAPADDFGLEHKRQPEDSEDKIYAKVVTVKEDPYGKLIIALDNGHTWRQTDGTSLRLSSNETIYVERGVFGAFFLGKDSQNRRIRVKRAK